MRTSYLTQLLTWFSLSAASATPALWTQTHGPEGPDVTAIAADGSSLYIYSILGIYKSSNKGESWTKIGLDTGKVTRPTAFAVRGDTLYVQGDSGLQIGMGEGASWRYSKLGAYGDGPYASMHSIVVDTGSLWMSTNKDGFYRSTNDGQSWSRINTDMLWNPFLYSYDPSIVVAGGGNVFLVTANGMFRSSNKGETWIRCASVPGTQDTVVQRAIIHPPYLFALTNYKIYRSADSGSHWIGLDLGAEIGVHNQFDNINSLDFVGERLFATTDDEGLFFSEDFGSHWTRIPEFSYLDNHTSVVQIIGLGTDLFAATYSGVLRSSDQGRTWIGMHNGISRGAAFHLVGGSPGNILAGGEVGIYSTVDLGNQWTRIPFRQNWPTALFRFGGAIFASENNDGLYKSQDDGRIWERVGVGSAMGDSAQGGEKVFSVGASLYYWAGSSGLSISSDSGRTWISAPGWNRDAPSTMAGFAGHHYAISEDTLFRFEPELKIWQTLANLPSVSSLDVIGVQGSTMLRGGIHGLFGSSDSGTTWTRLIDSAATGQVYCLLTVGQNVYAGTDSGVVVGRAGSPAWTIENTGLPPAISPPNLRGGRSILSLLAQDGFLFAGLMRDGIWKIPLDQIGSAIASRSASPARHPPAKWSFVSGGIGFDRNSGKSLRNVLGRTFPTTRLRQ